MLNLGFSKETLSDSDITELSDARKRCACSVVVSTTLATCGHPGGSLSTLDALLTLYSNYNI